jgi:hypothetical protein
MPAFHRKTSGQVGWPTQDVAAPRLVLYGPNRLRPSQKLGVLEVPLKLRAPDVKIDCRVAILRRAFQ